MALPDIDQIRKLTRKHVLDADTKGTLHLLTPKLLRREIEKELDLDKGALDKPEYRNAVKEAIEATMPDTGGLNKDEAVPEESDKPEPSTSKKSATKGKKRASDAGVDANPKKPRVAKKEGAKPTKEKKGKTKAVNRVPSPEPGQSVVTGTADDHVEDQKPAPKKPPAKRRKVAPVRIEESEDEGSDGTHEPEPKPAPAIAKDEASDADVIMSSPKEDPVPIPNDATQEKDMVDYKSESELSVLMDESPKRKRKSKANKDDTKAKKTSTKKTSAKNAKKPEVLSKDEETIKKLKSLVQACGVRKVWSKVFQGLDTPSQQIKKLKEILHELGMTGRMSVEQAKSIKAKRELAQELQDVQEFEKAINKSGQRHGADKDQEKSESEDNEEEEEDGNPRPRRRKTAAQDISAFLGDQSSDED